MSALKTRRYNLVITDFEPTVSWAAKIRDTPSLAIGHQYALDSRAPKPSGNQFARWLLKNFAPADEQIGFHWHRYANNVLPPMIDTTLQPVRLAQGFTLVYLPFDELNSIAALLQQFGSEHFVICSPKMKQELQTRNMTFYPLSKNGFRYHLQSSSRVLCNTGFELIAEALHLGIPVMTKPLQGQYEQSANAMALKELNLATVVPTFTKVSLERFINSSTQLPRRVYPDVANSLADYCLQQLDDTADDNWFPDRLAKLSERLWAEVEGSQMSSDPGFTSFDGRTSEAAA